jgi:CheY-like chemotaxis protein
MDLMGNVVSFPRMRNTPEQRRGPDRRRRPRGGRREEDLDGLAPLVLLVGDDEEVVDQSEAVLAKLRFGVTTTTTVEDALRVLAGIRPDIVVAGPADAHRIRMEAPEHLPVVVMTEEMRVDRAVLIEGIRRTLRSSRAK